MERVKPKNEVTLNEFIILIKSYLKYLISQWILVVLFILIGGILGYLFVYKKKPIYTATTTFVLEEDDGGGGNPLAGLASIAGVDMSSTGGLFKGDNILELYKSRSMLEKTLLSKVNFRGKKILLVERYMAINNWPKSLFDRQVFLNKSPSGIRVKDSIMGLIVEDVNNRYLTVIRPDKKLSILKAEVKSPDDFFSKEFNELIVKNVNDFYVQTKVKKVTQNINLLQRKVDSIRSILYGAIYTGASITDATPNLNPTRQVTRTVPLQRSQIVIESTRATLGDLIQNLELARMSLVKESPLIQIIDSPVLPLKVSATSKFLGLFIGGIIGGVIAVLFLSGRLFISKIKK